MQRRDLEEEKRRFAAHQSGESLDDSIASVGGGSPPPPTPADGGELARTGSRWAQARDKTVDKAADKTVAFRAEALVRNPDRMGRVAAVDIWARLLC